MYPAQQADNISYLTATERNSVRTQKSHHNPRILPWPPVLSTISKFPNDRLKHSCISY